MQRAPILARGSAFFRPGADGHTPAGNANFGRVEHVIRRLDPKGFPVAVGSDGKG